MKTEHIVITVLLVAFAIAVLPVTVTASSVITIDTEKPAYFLGESFTVSGINNDSEYITIYIQGVNFESTPIVSQPISVSADDSWSATIDSSEITNTNGRRLDAGTYTITAVASGSTIPENTEGFSNATTACAFKQPYISITSAPEVIVQGTGAEFSINAEASPNGILWYIFGTNFFNHGAVNTPNSEDTPNQFTVTLTKEDTDMSAGQYFVVFQHPMYDRMFNIGPKGSEIVLKLDGSYTSSDSTILFNVLDRQTANAAQALCDSLDAQNIDDMYVKHSFFVVGEIEEEGEISSFITSVIPTEVVKGNKIVVSGVAPEDVGKLVTVDMISTAFAAVPKETVPSEAFIRAVTTIAVDGTWKVTLDTSDLNVDEYVLSIACDGVIRKTSIVDVSGSVLPDPVIPDSFDAVVTPSGSLVPGQTVTAAMKIVVTGGSVDASDKITLSTPLTSAQWTTVIYRGGQAVSAEGKHSSTIYGFDLDYGDTDVTLQITLTGVVSESSAGKQISVMNIVATADALNGHYRSYSSKKQMVYNPDNFEYDLAASKTYATNLEERAAIYAGYGIDTASVISTITQAKTKITAAESQGISYLISAYANIEAADTLLVKADRNLTFVGLKAVNSNLVKLEAAANEFSNRGWNDEELYYETKSLNMRATYDSLVMVYNNGGIPDSVKVDALVVDSFETLAKAEDALSGAGKLPASVTLKSGWNFISVPKALEAANASASVLFGSVDTDGVAILAYNSESQSWEQLTADTVIKPLTGYWIYSNGTVEIPLTYVSYPTVPAVKQLYPGWNAVGVSAETSIPASSFLAGTTWRVALPWDLSKGKWDNVVVNGGSSVNSAEQHLNLVNGIWLYSETDGTLIGLTA